MRVAAGEAIRRLDVDEVNRRQRHEVAQTLQGRAYQIGTAVAAVDEPQVVTDGMAVLLCSRSQLRQLALDGVMLSLLVGGDPGIERDLQALQGRGGSQMRGSHGILP
jgi:hypothetical protein